MDPIIKLKRFLNANHGYISRNELFALDLTRTEIDKFIKNQVIRRVAHGIYIDNNLLEDELYIIQYRYPDVVYSFNTAFFVMGLTERIPSVYDVTVPKGKRIRDELGLKVHHNVQERYELGVISVISPCGNPIKIYDLERSICDTIKYNKEIEPEIASKIIKTSFKQKKVDIDKLLDYAEKMNIFNEIKILIGALLQWQKKKNLNQRLNNLLKIFL